MTDTDTRFSLPDSLRDWLVANAESLDRDASVADQLLPRLADAGLIRIGVAASDGGTGGDVCDATDVIAALAEYSLTAAFVLWAQRSFVEYVISSPNKPLRERWLAPVLDGRRAGASGLSNAMKFLAGVEALQIDAVDTDSGWRLDGRMPWVTNLRRPDFVVAAAVTRGPDRPSAVVALPGERAGMHRKPDLDLLALRGSNTAAIDVKAVEIDDADVFHHDGPSFLRSVRPGFLGLQCGMSIGLARTALETARAGCRADRHVLIPRVEAATKDLIATTAALYEGVRAGRFVTNAVPLFELRIRLSNLVQEAVHLELQASGGRAYLLDPPSGFGRRWREAAFVPVVTPSVTQLQAELQNHHLARVA